MSLDEELLETVARDGSMDYDKWPGMLEPLIERLDQIVRNDFPTPKIPPELAPSFARQQPSVSCSYPLQDSSSFQSSNKENAPPSDQQLYSRPSEPLEPSSERVPDSQPDTSDDALPPPLLALLSSIKSTLRSYFASKPPHTIQRLAELILHPTRQYRTLPAYLRAVDRVVSVSSTADIFPLPRVGPGDMPNGIANGTSTGFMVTDDSLGSDESLGGALLTPIPWLTNTGLEGNGEDSAEGAVTQGELIRQEQEAGIVMTPTVTATEGETGESHASPPPDEIPHARGPPVVGVEDMGLQDGRGVEMTLSTPNVAPGSDKSEYPSEQSTGGDAGVDGDIVLNDVTGKESDQEASEEIAKDGTESKEQQQEEQQPPSETTDTTPAD
ncbi:hypothetical protein VTN77DRAFT_9001 [Rasamsonia byssochlamydoides]|uniref:uncharacterized protein n=1 Tax=Rasamsonia byssochlamydoides TaxID=89139 RepID=UPI003741FB80